MKGYCFLCQETNRLAYYKKYIKHYKKADRLKCWKASIIQDLSIDCYVENYARCPKCNSDDIIGCSIDRFICTDCKIVFELDDDGYRTVIGDEYEEIDMAELKAKFD